MRDSRLSRRWIESGKGDWIKLATDGVKILGFCVRATEPLHVNIEVLATELFTQNILVKMSECYLRFQNK
jgi:hypothetical protein